MIQTFCQVKENYGIDLYCQLYGVRFLDKRNSRMNIDLIFSVIIFLYFFLIFLDYFFDIRMIRYINFGMSFSVLYFMYNKYDENKKNIVIIILLMVFMFVSSVHTGNKNLYGIIMSTSYFLMGLNIVNTKLDLRIFTVSFYLHAAILLFSLLITEDANTIFNNISRNYISVIMLLQYSLLYLAHYMRGKVIGIAPSFLVLFVAVLSMGRSGIISASILFVGSLFILYKQQRDHVFLIRKEIKVLIFIIAGITLFAIFSDKVNILDNFETIIRRLENLNISENVRMDILMEYIRRLSRLDNLLLGVDLSKVPIFRRWDLNLHNSFLHLHANFGIMGVLLVLFGFAKSAYYFLKGKEFLLLVLLASLIFRSLTDKLAFSGIFDSILIAMIFLGSKVRQYHLEK